MLRYEHSLVNLQNHSKMRLPQKVLVSAENSIKKSVLIPKGKFSMRANAVQSEPLAQLLCSHALFNWQKRQTDRPLFKLQDGPPYANGELHLGHLLNKVLKDFIIRYKVQRGFRIEFTPGWDCHGLPIELKALESVGVGMEGMAIRGKARKWAEKFVKVQSKQFQRWGVMGEWENPYLTMSKSYESKQLELFGKLVEQGFVYRAMKPVYWSPSSQTALAEAELEYIDDHISKAVHVLFPLEPFGSSDRTIFACIWTTTPWTLPGNVAIAFSENLEYVIAEKGDTRILLAKERIGELEGFSAAESVCLAQLRNLKAKHPLYNRLVPFVPGKHVTGDVGTGLVHTAPAHGQEDFDVCAEHGIGMLQYVAPDGTFLMEAGEDLQGKDIFTHGTDTIISKLIDSNLLLKQTNLTHRYPYDWRTKRPVIQRATSQWFLDLSKMQSKANSRLDEIHFVPSKAKDRLKATIASRKEWCISRQRHWGVPIPVFYEEDSPILDTEIIQHVQSLVALHGTDCWWSFTVEQLLPESWKHRADQLVKGFDTFDVWFDSGSAWYASGDESVADLILEGSDQHRGWFQSSLLLSSVAEKGPFKILVSHGFVLDKDRKKMSKSLGNVISPQDICEKGLGAEVLRYWAASSDFRSDSSISDQALEKCSLGLRKLRNSFKFMIGAVEGFDHGEITHPLDFYMMSRLSQLSSTIEGYYEKFEFLRVLKAIEAFNSNELSALYFSACKDRLYLSAPNDQMRVSAQATMQVILEVLCKLTSPILPHLVAEVNKSLIGKEYKQADAMIEQTSFVKGWVELEAPDMDLDSKWKSILEIRDLIHLSGNMPSNPLDAKVLLQVPQTAEYLPLLKSLQQNDELSNTFLVSQVELNVFDDGNVKVTVEECCSDKCTRCWKRTNNTTNIAVTPSGEEHLLCNRCFDVISKVR